MGILDGVVEWISEQIMHGLDLINTSVLGALGCGMETFLRYFPAAETMYDIFTAIGIGLISYTVIKVFTGKAKDVSALTYVISVLFLIKFFLIV